MNFINLLREYLNPPKKQKNKWVAFFLCLFFGFLGAHKFYEGKIPIGIIYICTAGIFGFGWISDTLSYLFFKENPYLV